MDRSFASSAARDRRASLAELEAQITELAGQLNAAQYRWLMLIAEFDRLEELGHTHADLGIRIDRDTAATRWRGERMDYELGVWVLCQQAERARGIRRDGVFNASNDASLSDVSAETSETFADLECATDAD